MNTQTKFIKNNKMVGEIDNFIKGVEKIHKGYVLFEVIPPHTMRNAIETVERQLSQSRPMFPLVHNDIGLYYTRHLTTYTYSRINLFIITRVPFAVSDPFF